MGDEAKYLLASHDKKYFIKIVGSARYSNCAAFGSFVLNKLLRDDSCEDILVDLRETDFLDSTNLGLLAKMGGFIFSKFHRKMAVVSTDKSINDLLVNTGFDRIMLIIDNPDYVLSELGNLPEASQGEMNLAKLMLEAHQELMELSDENKRKFRTVVEMLKDEME